MMGRSNGFGGTRWVPAFLYGGTRTGFGGKRCIAAFLYGATRSGFHGSRSALALLYVGPQIAFGGTWWVAALLYVGPKAGSVGRGGSQLFSTWDPHRVRWDPVGPSSSLRGTRIGFGGTRWVPALLYVGPASGSVGPGGSQLFSTWDPHRVRWDPVGPGGSQPFSTWDPTPRLGFTMLIRGRGGPAGPHPAT